VECAYVASTITSLPYFASRISLGKNGIEEYLPIGSMGEIEKNNYEMMQTELVDNITKGVEFVKNRY
jgi:malate dehydrogenase